MRSVKNYVEAINKGIIKVISKIGNSTTQGYCGAQIFEALGLHVDVIDKYFTWTPSRIGGVGLDVIAEEARLRHAAAYALAAERTLDSGGEYQFRVDGAHHLFNPLTIHKLQQACPHGNYETFKEYSDLVNEQAANVATLRGVMSLASDKAPLSIDEVEPIETIMKRYRAGAMSTDQSAPKLMRRSRSR